LNTRVLFIESLVWSAIQALKYTVPYGAPRFSIFRKLNNKSYLII